MLKRTHFVIAFFISMYFLPYVNDKVLFLPIILLATFIPDIDVIFGRPESKILKPLRSQPYKNFMHSYTLCIAVSMVLAFFYPVVAFPFFLGYSFHLVFDSMTVNGISPFWPLKTRLKGFITPGGKTEKSIVLVLGFLTILMVVSYLF